MTGLLRRFLERADDNLTWADDQLELAIPSQRKPRTVYFAHCPCCKRYMPQPCPVIHTSPCDKPACGQTWDDNYGGVA